MELKISEQFIEAEWSSGDEFAVINGEYHTPISGIETVIEMLQFLLDAMKADKERIAQYPKTKHGWSSDLEDEYPTRTHDIDEIPF